MKKINYKFIILFLLSIPFIIIGLNTKDDKNIIQPKNDVVENTVKKIEQVDQIKKGEQNIKLIRKLQNKRSPSQAFKKVKKEKSRNDSAITGYKKEKIKGVSQNVSVVSNVIALNKLIPGKDPLFSSGSYFFYDEKIHVPQDQQSSMAIYDHSSKQYGIFTGEIIASGDYKNVISIIEVESWEVMYKNEDENTVIFKINSSDIGELSNIQTNAELKMDIKFSRSKPM